MQTLSMWQKQKYNTLCSQLMSIWWHKCIPIKTLLKFIRNASAQSIAKWYLQCYHRIIWPSFDINKVGYRLQRQWSIKSNITIQDSGLGFCMHITKFTIEVKMNLIPTRRYMVSPYVFSGPYAYSDSLFQFSFGFLVASAHCSI